jgi:hypothetical protein
MEIRQSFICQCGNPDNEPVDMDVVEELKAVGERATGQVFRCPRCGERTVFSSVPDPGDPGLMWQATLVRLSKSNEVKKP